jgi:CHAT domain-containing protein/Tfp pilus assembly protein PilF
VAPTSAYGQDPIDVFITAADSIATAGGDGPLGDFVAKNQAIAGAAVGLILDIAIEVGDAGQKDGEAENIVFCDRVARAYKERTGSTALTDLVTIYSGWNSTQRATRQKAKNLEVQANEAKSARDYDTAVKQLNEAKALYEQIDDRRSVAVIWGTLGVVQWGAGNMDAVFENYEQALAARRAIEDHILEGRTLNGLGSANYVTGQLDAAAEYYGKAIEVRRSTGDRGGLGTSLTYIGNVYRDSGRPIEARTAYEQASELLEGAGQPAQQSELLNSIANLYFDMGRIQASNEAYLEAIDFAQTAKDAVMEIMYRINLGWNLGEEFRFAEALDQFAIVEELLASEPDPTQQLRFYQNRGMVYQQMDEFDRAREDLLKFLELATEYDAPDFKLEAQINLGHLLDRMGSYDRAVEYAERAKELAYELANGRMAREADFLAALAHRLAGRHDKALEHFNSALEQDEYDGLERQVLQDRLGIANIHALAGRSEKARTFYRSVHGRLQGSGQKQMLMTVEFGLAHTFESTNPDSAAHYYERALQRLEKTRESLRGAATQTGFLSGLRRHYYEEVARYYASVFESKREDEWSGRAFKTIERAKARGLLDMLQTSVASQESQEERQSLDALYQLSSDTPDYANEKRRLEDRYTTLRDARLQRTVGGLSGDAGIADLEHVQKSIEKKTAVLAYALGDSASFVWLIDRKGAEMYELPPRSALRVDVERLRDALSRPGAGDTALRRASRQLYEILIAPGEERLSKARSIVIVPDGFLFEIPFEILLTEDVTDDQPWGELPFLARDFTTVYAPSVSVFLRLQKEKKRKYNIDLLAVGDPDFSSLDGAKLAPLPYTRAEVLGISDKVKDSKKSVLIGEDASEAVLKRQLRESTPRLLHLATHGLIDPVEPAASSVALCRDESSTEDGYLHTLEILSLPLDVGLVVLSACESARGKVSRGEGVVGLSRAFIASGADGIVASLWSVSDESTSALMKKFYENMLGRKKSAGEAMSKARLALLDDPATAHPFYWSPFIVIGSERSPW